MDIRTSLTAALALALSAGCEGMKPWQTEAKVPAGVPTAPLSPSVKPEASPIVQASASIPANTSTPAGASSIAKLTGKPAPPKLPASEMTVMWRNKVDYLPDPTHNGVMGAGLAGQLFLYGPNMLPAVADGKLTVALYDETPRPPGQKANLPEGWEFTKDDLKKLVTMDERFGKSYALFLPWPTFRPDVTKVRIAVRYDPEQGHPLYASETKIALDNTPTGDSGATTIEWSHQTTPAGSQSTGGFSPLGGPPPGEGPGLGVLVSGNPNSPQPSAPNSSQFGPPIPIGGGMSAYGNVALPAPGSGAVPPSQPSGPAPAIGSMPMPPNLGATPPGLPITPVLVGGPARPAADRIGNAPRSGDSAESAAAGSHGAAPHRALMI